ncbi:MAG: dodecin domain-containing protein [Hyphomonadaceae bacterium]
MAVAKVIELTAAWKKSLQDAIEQGMSKASDTLGTSKAPGFRTHQGHCQERQDQRMAREHESDVRAELAFGIAQLLEHIFTCSRRDAIPTGGAPDDAQPAVAEALYRATDSPPSRRPSVWT